MNKPTTVIYQQAHQQTCTGGPPWSPIRGSQTVADVHRGAATESRPYMAVDDPSAEVKRLLGTLSAAIQSPIRFARLAISLGRCAFQLLRRVTFRATRPRALRLGLVWLLTIIIFAESNLAFANALVAPTP